MIHAAPGQRPAARAVFVPSVFNARSHLLGGIAGWGASSTSAPSGEESDYVALFQQLAPGVATLIQGKDARETRELLKARIKNLTKMKAKFPALSLYYDNEITKLKARLKSVEKAAEETDASARATGEWRVLGQTAIGVGILTGVAVLALVIVKTVKEARR